MKARDKVYIASPLFTAQERANVNEVAEVWQKNHPLNSIYKPQDFQVPNAWDMTNTKWADAVEAEDRKHLDEADVVIGILYGMNGDDGTAWEIGYASAKGKEIVLFFMNEGGTYSLMMKNITDKKILRQNCSGMEGRPKAMYSEMEDFEVFWS